MDDDNYVKYITQKYRLAVSIAVLKNKPINLSIEDYIKQLKSKLEHEKMDIDEFDYTICSDDFKFDDDLFNTIENTKTDVAVTDECKTNKIINKSQPTIKTIDNDTMSINNSLDILKEINEIENHNDGQSQSNSVIVTQCDNQLTCEMETQIVDAETHPKIIDTQETEIYDYAKLLQSQNLTHISQSQDEDKRFEILEKYVLGFSKRKKLNVEIPNTVPQEERDEVIEDLDLTQINAFDDVNNTNTSNNTSNILNNTQQQENIEEICPNNNEKETFLENSNPEPKMPFHVLEKLNRIRQELNKKQSTLGCSLESGYRSDSQSQQNAVPNVDSYLINAGESVLAYLLESQTTSSTNDVLQDMSKVFGDFIDKLHSDEIYPHFLETVMDKIFFFLNEIRTTSSCGLDAIPVKNDTISRILLVNSSIHIRSYTIDCIVGHLQEFHVNITSHDELYEMRNICHVENICYVLYVLEQLLQGYTEKKKSLSSSQKEEGNIRESFLKKSSITNIWKSKWDPNYSKTENQNGVKQDGGDCVTVKCGDVLKKIIVDCMESYSLISYAALQCFNYIQE